MAPKDRLSQVSSHLNYPQGMLSGQVAIITGSGQGIGAEAARMFANEGAKVVIADLDIGTYTLPRTTCRALSLARRWGLVFAAIVC